MSTAFNKRRGAKANAPRPVRICRVYKKAWRSVSRTDRGIEGITMLEQCGAAVPPNRNGNNCGEAHP